MAFQQSLGLVDAEFAFSNFDAFNGQLGKHLQEHGIGMQRIGRDIMRTLGMNLIKFTPPKNLKQGRQRVDSDIKKVIKAMPPQYWEAKDILNLPDDANVLMHKAKGGAVYLVDKVQHMQAASKGQMSKMHQSARLKSGRVTTARGGSDVGRNTINIGRWKTSPWMYTEEANRASYIRFRQKSVGKLKSGWAPGANYFARVTGGPRRIPKFASQTRHGKHGRYVDAFTPSGGGYGILHNQAGYGVRSMNKAVRLAHAQARRYTEKATPKQIEKIVERFNRLP